MWVAPKSRAMARRLSCTSAAMIFVTPELRAATIAASLRRPRRQRESSRLARSCFVEDGTSTCGETAGQWAEQFEWYVVRDLHHGIGRGE